MQSLISTQAANWLRTLFRHGTWDFPALDMFRESRGERIFSACLQRSVFPSIILWEVTYLADKNRLLQCKEQKILFGLKCYARESLSQSFSSAPSIFEYFLRRRTGLTETMKIHENISIHPNTSPNISVVGLFFLMVGNANSSLLRQMRGLSLGLLHSRQALWRLNISRLGPSLS